ncbi:MAG: TetR/AcrR family transcriptional regulator [Eubacteriales bacterium]|nr:TetR/AcrR family transcriptional regulator [Eubacteriales bacterium]
MKDQKKLQSRQLENKRKIIDATVSLIKKEGVDSITVRRVCDVAGIATGTFYYYFKNKDELLLSFIMESSFEDFELCTPLSDPAHRILELYTILVDKYLSFGREFMQSFYTPANTALASYMSEIDGAFLPGTVMARCESEIRLAQEAGFCDASINAHEASEDICAIVKGAIFEYSLNCTAYDIHAALARMITRYLA